uniref:Parvin, gamma n=1 Tax=Callorhinchus milii TaxID=7868 RepID=A0A4W3IMK5_CALMI|eukprot:gi/632954138/ref/XP_007892802.1/ PREDICTED: gamma-parvin [Callorhinchus milii]
MDVSNFENDPANDLVPEEARNILQPSSLLSPQLQELKMFLIDWINRTLKRDHIVVQSLEEDIYDGLVLHHMLVHLGDVKLEVGEIAFSTSAQRHKLKVVLDTVNQLLQVTDQSSLKWSVELINNKDLLATLHLLVAIMKHFRPDLDLPKNVYVEKVTYQIDSKLVKSQKHLEYITEQSDENTKADAIDNLFTLGPDKMNTVKQALLHFTNNRVQRLGITVNEFDSQFANGVILILLIGQLEGYFIRLSEYHLSPSSHKEMLHNVTLALEILKESRVSIESVTPEDIVNMDSKATFRVLYALFTMYKDK